MKTTLHLEFHHNDRFAYFEVGDQYGAIELFNCEGVAAHVAHCFFSRQYREVSKVEYLSFKKATQP